MPVIRWSPVVVACAVLCGCGGAPSSNLLESVPDGGHLDAGIPPGDASTDAGSAVPETTVPDSAADHPQPAETGPPPPTDAGPAGPIPCSVNGGTLLCYTNDFCCVTADPLSSACEGTGSACGGTEIYCADQADCPGQVCCATKGKISCETTCGGTRLCDPSHPVCAASRTCTAIVGLPGYYACE